MSMGKRVGDSIVDTFRSLAAAASDARGNLRGSGCSLHMLDLEGSSRLLFGVGVRAWEFTAAAGAAGGICFIVF